jgi:streptogrisin B
VSITPGHPRGRIGRLLVAAVSAVAVGLFLVPTGASAAPQRYSASALSAANRAVDKSGVEGVSWYIDAAASRVVVTADSSVSSAEIAAIRRAVGANGAALRITRTAGVFAPLLSAGDAIYGGKYRCSLGFNAVSGSTYYFLTAGHCGSVAKTWYTNSGHTTLIGPTVGYSFPGNDYALVRYDNTSLSHPGGFTVADPFVGEQVTRKGSTTGTHTGTVTALNVSVRYAGHPGGSGDCTSGGTTFFQPVREAVNAYGVTIL